MPIKLLFKRKPAYDYEKSRICASCENKFHGRFCNICGERAIEPHERSLKEFVLDAWNSFTFLDGKFMRSLSHLIMKPGQMSLDISQGKRIGYMKPIALFLVANLIYFLFPFARTFNTTLTAQQRSFYGKVINSPEQVEEKIEELKIDPEAFETKFNQKSTIISKTILITIIPIFSIFLALIFVRSKRLFFDHLLFSIEFFTYTMFVTTIGYSLFTKTLVGLNSSFINRLLNEDFFTLGALFITVYFVYRGLKTFYHQNTAQSIIMTIPTVLIFMLSVICYRILLFSITMLTL